MYVSVALIRSSVQETNSRLRSKMWQKTYSRCCSATVVISSVGNLQCCVWFKKEPETYDENVEKLWWSIHFVQIDNSTNILIQRGIKL